MTSFTHDTSPTQYAEGGGIRFAYRRFGRPGRPPLVFFQHFMGTLDDHDPALSDAFAGDREVILFNNTGVASSSGIVPGTIEAMARDAITFTGALALTTIDVVGHSMGGLVAQEVALARPDLVRRLMLAGTGPRGGEGIGARPAWVAELLTRKYERQEDMWLPILFAPARTSQAAGRAYIERITARADRDTRSRTSPSLPSARRSQRTAPPRTPATPTSRAWSCRSWSSTAPMTSSSRRSTPTSCSSSFPTPSSSCTRTPATARISSTPDCSPAMRAYFSTIS
ncbi:MAG TPA: alpha/beta hydrolase [Streptosporangiaceae bacterium]|nr:alpha/beta hydrolase [Streptosporangiaceae bacterium]